MKKSILALVLLGALLASCSSYTCATYAKKSAPVKEKADSKI